MRLHEVEYDVREEAVPGAPWVFIAVMGVTGAGKSTFIQWASGNEKIQIGHDLESCTSDITAYTFYCNGYNVNLVDTPGFNDTHKSETEVLQDIATWLKETYEGSTRLSGIIYLHSLMNVRMEGSALRNLKMFRQLCGPEPLKNVILATTFWSAVGKDDALRREDQLKTTPEFWGDMLERGSTMKRMIDRKSTLDIIDILLKKPTVTLQIQEELVNSQKSLVDTAAGQTVNEELIRQAEQHKEALARVQEELREALNERDLEMQEILEQQQNRLDKEINKVMQQQELLRYDRRAERRRMEAAFEARLTQLQREYEAQATAKQEALLQELNFDQAVAAVRANEAKISVREREKLELKIAELEKVLNEQQKATKKGETADRKKKGSSRYLFRALQVVLPVTTMALLGFPIPSPFGSGEQVGGLVNKLFGSSEEGRNNDEPGA